MSAMRFILRQLKLAARRFEISAYSCSGAAAPAQAASRKLQADSVSPPAYAGDSWRCKLALVPGVVRKHLAQAARRRAQAESRHTTAP